MKLALVTDAWAPQVNGVVTTLVELVEAARRRGHQVEVIEPSAFRRFACPGYREIELAWRPKHQVAAYPVAGPLDVVGDSDGGVLHEDLRAAALAALELSRHAARARALQFDWEAASEQFLSMLVPARAAAGRLAEITV